MFLLRKLLLGGGLGRGGGAGGPVYVEEKSDYTFLYGAAAPYSFYYDYEYGDQVLIDVSDYIWIAYQNTQRKMVRIKATGVLWVIYVALEGTVLQVYVKWSEDEGETWGGKTRISTYSGMGSYTQWYPSIAVDSLGHLHVVWCGKATGYTGYDQIWYSKYDGSSWSYPVRLSTKPAHANYTQSTPMIAVDLSDNLHVVWSGRPAYADDLTNAQIWYTKFDGSTWSEPLRISTYSGMQSYYQYSPSVAVDGLGNLRVVWYGRATGYPTYNQIWYTYYDGAWATPVRISTYSGMESYHQTFPCIAIGYDDKLHVVWHGGATGFANAQIWYAKYDGAWSTPLRISTGSGMENYLQQLASIAVRKNGSIPVLWIGRATGLSDYDKVFYANYIISWSVPECLQPTGSNTHPNLRWSRHHQD